MNGGKIMTNDLGNIWEQMMNQREAAGAQDPYGDVYQETELLRQGRSKDPLLSGLAPDQQVQLNRIAQTADNPFLALAAAPYEGAKAVEQATANTKGPWAVPKIPLLSGTSALLNKLGAGVATPNKSTSKASLNNVLSAFRGAGKGIARRLKKKESNIARLIKTYGR